MQQLTCKIDLSNSFYYLFFSFVLLELKSGFAKGGAFRTGVFRPEAHVKLTAPCRRHFAKQAGNGSRMNHPFCEYTNGSFCGTGGWVC